MKTLLISSLISAEQQFANIKRLIPEINALIGETAGMEKIYKKRFKLYSEKWDLMQETIFQLDSFKHLGEKERTFVSTFILGMVQKLVYPKRLSYERMHSYQVAKTTFHELLLELADQHREEGLRGDMPIFVKAFDVKTSLVNRKKEDLRALITKLKKRRAKKQDKVLVLLQKKRFPSFLKQVFVKMHVDLKYLSEPKHEEKLILKEKISAFRRRKLSADKKNKPLEGTAYGLIEKMLKHQLDLFEKTENSFKDFYTEFCQAVKEFEKS